MLVVLGYDSVVLSFVEREDFGLAIAAAVALVFAAAVEAEFAVGPEPELVVIAAAVVAELEKHSLA